MLRGNSGVSGRGGVLPVQLAASRTRTSTSSIDSTAAILARGSTAGEVGGDEGDLGVDFGVGRVVGRRRAGRGFGRLHAQRIEGRDVGGEFGGREREIAGDAHEGADAHDLAIADTAGLGVANDPALGVRFAGRRQAVGLARGGGGAVAGAAQRKLHALGHGGEIALAVERRKNGAAHEGRAAQTGQDCAAEPLYRHAAAIDEIAGLAVDGQRRLMAEVDMIGLATRPVCATPFAVIQDRPLHSHRGWLATNSDDGVPKTRPTTGLRPRTQGTMPRFERSVNGPSPVVLAMSGSTLRPLRLRPWCRIPRTDTSRRRKVGSRNVAQVRPLGAVGGHRPPLEVVHRDRPYPRHAHRTRAVCCAAKVGEFVGLGC